MLASYIVGIILWSLVTHTFWFALLGLRFLLLKPPTFLPSWFWYGEMFALFLGMTLGFWTTTLILIVQSVENKS